MPAWSRRTARSCPPPCSRRRALGLINVHASLLPRHRGAAPVHRAVIAGDGETGVSIMRVVQALDAGGVFATAVRPIGPDDTSADVERDLARLGAALLLEVLGQLASGTAVEVPQDDSAATYAPRLRKEEGLIDWRAPAAAIHNQVRGLQPWPMAWTSLGGRRLIVIRTRAVPDATDSGLAPGSLLHLAKDALPGPDRRGAARRAHRSARRPTGDDGPRLRGRPPGRGRCAVRPAPGRPSAGPAGRRRLTPMAAIARVVALDTLRRVHAGHADLASALEHGRRRLADERDQALAAEIALGTLRWRAALDHAIAWAGSRAIGAFDADVLDILRLSAYQLLHLDRVPAAAVVNDAVGLTRQRGRASAAGAVNAILRRISRDRTRSADARGVRPARLSQHHVVPPGLAGGQVDRSVRVRRRTRVGAPQQRGGAGHAAGEHTRHLARRPGREPRTPWRADPGLPVRA